MVDKLAGLRALGVSSPVMQAGMPLIAGPQLAAAVSRAGGIGTLGITDVSDWGMALALTRRLCQSHPFNANLLLPFTRPRHVDLLVSQQVPMATLFWGRDARLIQRLKRAGIFTFQQVGSMDEACFALDAGIDALIVQGREAGGHVRGTSLLKAILPPIVDQADAVPVFAAGGMYTAQDARQARQMGASGVASGTRFVATFESDAHEAYKRALVESDGTILTTLFGMNWDAPHRVLPNEATRRWCDADGQARGWIKAINALTEKGRRFMPMQSRHAWWQRPYLPVLTGTPLDASMPAEMKECTALYAGAEVGRITSVMHAADVVRELASAFAPMAVGGHEQPRVA